MQLTAFLPSFAVRTIPVSRRYVRWIWTIVGILTAIDVAWSAQIGLTIRSVGPGSAAVAALSALAVMYRYRIRSLAEIAGVAASWFALAICIVVLSYLCATSRQPLQDPIFLDLDRRVGFDWWAWRGVVLDRPWLNVTLCAAYASIGPQILLSIAYLPASNRTYQAYELVLLSSVTAIFCCAASALWPAIGPSFEFRYVPDLLALRSPGPWQFDLPAMNGIVTMPSYHTTLAVLLTYALRNTGAVAWGIAGLNIIMLFAVPPIGGHYLVDMAAGAAIGGLAVGLVRWTRR